MIEMHYENHKKENGRVDNSGLKLYFTKTYREHDLGLLMLGADGSTNSILLPAKTDSLTLRTLCYPECTQVNIYIYIYYCVLK